MSKHRAEVKPRWGRIAALGLAVGVTGVALLGGVGILPSSGAGAAIQHVSAASDQVPTAAVTPAPTPTPAGAAAPQADPLGPLSSGASDVDALALPAHSGTGRRIVFSMSRQRVWLVDDSKDKAVRRTYLVSGSKTDNLQPGTYHVYSKSKHAIGVDDSGTMQWFVRFTQGPSGAAIGFHNIPVKDGRKIQTAAQLGTPQSHGCIRQQTGDALALWSFAPLGTTVVVTA